jgi:outer membrane receptor protein involved in Fe transport
LDQKRVAFLTPAPWLLKMITSFTIVTAQVMPMGQFDTTLSALAHALGALVADSRGQKPRLRPICAAKKCPLGLRCAISATMAQAGLERQLAAFSVESRVFSPETLYARAGANESYAKGSQPRYREARLAGKEARGRSAARAVCMLLPFTAFAIALGALAWAGQQELGGTVKDALGRPLALARIELRAQNGKELAHAVSDSQGRFQVPAAGPGVYALTVRKDGFKPAIKVVTLPAAKGEPVAVVLESESALTVPIREQVLRAQNGLSATGATKYTMTERDIEELPQGEYTPLSDVLAQMPGVSYDRNGLIHVRGWAIGNVQYQVNGVMLPLNIYTNSGFVQVLNSFIVKDVSLLDGILPAQYGFENNGVVQVKTKDGCTDKGGDVGIYGGQRETAQPSFEMAGCHDKLSYYVMGMYQHDNIGFSSATPAPNPIHDLSDLGEGFGYFTYDIAPTTRLSLLTGLAVWNSQFPNSVGLAPQYNLSGVNSATYPSTAIDANFEQRDYWAVLALNGLLSPALTYQLAYSIHYQSQHYLPDPVGDLIYQGAAPNALVEGLANTFQGDFTYQLGASHTLAAGFYVGAYNTVSTSFTLTFPVNDQGQQTSDTPIGLSDSLNGLNMVYGVYLQDTWKIDERLTANFGARWDKVTGFATGEQLSPSINLMYKVRPDATLHAGFARYFQIPNFMALSPTAFGAFANTSAGFGIVPEGAFPKPERDWYWDVGAVYHVTPRLVYQHDDYFRIDHDYLDYGYFGYVPIDIPFNFSHGYGWGTENSLTYNIENLTLRLNFTVGEEKDKGIATGQYNFDQQELQYIDSHYIVLDHEPLVALSGGAAYRWGKYLFSVDGIYGSGYVGGFADTQQEPMWWWVNWGVARNFSLPWVGEVQERIIVNNIFNRTNLLRPAQGIGVFQAMYAPRLAVYNSITVPIPPL